MSRESRAAPDRDGAVGRPVTDGGRTTGADRAADGELLERITDGFAALDDGLTITYVNGATEEILGVDADALVGTPLEDAVPQVAGTRFEEECRAALDRGEARNFEEYYGELDAWVEVRIYPAEDGLSVFFSDVTEERRVQEQLRASEAALTRLHTLAADAGLSHGEKLRRLLEIGRDRLGVDIGFLTDIDGETQEIVEAVGDHPEIRPGATAPLSEAYCRRTIGQEEPLAVDDAVAEGWLDDPAYERFRLGCYLGSTISVGGEQFGTVCFADDEPRERAFTETEETFVDLLTDWVSYVLEQRTYERELRDHQERLSGLLDTTQSLMQARSREEVARIAASAARRVLGFDGVLVRLYDAATGTLEPAGTAGDARPDDRPVVDVGEGHAGEVFASGEPSVVDDPDPSDHPDEGVATAMCYPVGVHGTISVGARDGEAFDGTDEQVLALLSTVAAAACTRAKREREVREAREHTERMLDRVNGLIEETIEVLVGATTREQLERGVVERLAAADPYTFAWIGRADLASETLAPTEWAGEADVPAAELSVDLGSDHPVAIAYEEGATQVVGTAGEGGEWLAGGARSCMVIPLAYTDATYGVVAVYADEADAFDEREQVVLGALGRAIANAINAVERGRILDADRVIELEFTVDDADLLLTRLSRGGDCVVESASVDYRSDGRLQWYLSADGGDGERLAELAREDGTVTAATCIVDGEDGCLLEVTVEESLVATLAEYGAVPQEVVADGGTARFTVELPYEAQAREVFNLVKERYPGTELVGYHEHERPVETRQEFRAALSERFTERQETALRTAFLGGFFDWPRGVDGNELAEAMGISRPTYHQHLRAAQRKVLEELFDPQ